MCFLELVKLLKGIGITPLGPSFSIMDKPFTHLFSSDTFLYIFPHSVIYTNTLLCICDCHKSYLNTLLKLLELNTLLKLPESLIIKI